MFCGASSLCRGLVVAFPGHAHATLMAITDFLLNYSKSPLKRRQPHDLETQDVPVRSTSLLQRFYAAAALATILLSCRCVSAALEIVQGASATTMKISATLSLRWWRCYDLDDGATRSLRFCILSIQKLWISWFILSKNMDRRAQAAMLQLVIMNHRLIMWDDEVQARRRRRAKRFWVHHGYICIYKGTKTNFEN